MVDAGAEPQERQAASHTTVMYARVMSAASRDKTRYACVVLLPVYQVSYTVPFVLSGGSELGQIRMSRLAQSADRPNGNCVEGRRGTSNALLCSQ